jgi:hypothetical protein
MLFAGPVPFEEAVSARKVKALLPTELTHAEMSRIRPEIRQVSTFSARTSNAEHIARLNTIVDEMIKPDKWEDGATRGMTTGTGRLQLKESLKAMGYDPEEPGTIKDLSSDQRLNLMINTNAQLAWGYGQWKEGQDETVLDLFPAQELFRLEDRKEPRDWNQIWFAAAASSDPRILAAFQETGRFIALKSSNIWMAISDFGVPYPPYKFNSGMWIQDIEREIAVDIGLMGETEDVHPLNTGFAQGYQISLETLPDYLQQMVLEDLGSGYKFEGGVLKRV